MEKIDIVDSIENLASDVEKLEYLSDSIFRLNPKTNSEADFNKVLMVCEMASEYVEKIKTTSLALREMQSLILN